MYQPLLINQIAGVHCRVSEDNLGGLTIATLPKVWPHTKHINNKHWHFREYVEQGKITIHTVSTQDQILDLLTKPLAERDFTVMKHKIMGENSRRRSPHLPGSERKHEEQDKTNDNNWVRVTPHERDSHKMRERQQRDEEALGNQQTSKESKDVK